MQDLPYKEILGAITIFLVFFGHFFYIKSILKGETKPHIYTNIIWIILMGIGSLLQFQNGGGPGSWMLGLTAISNIFILFLAFKYCTKDITRLDTILFILALLCIPIYLFVDNKLYSLILIIIIDLLGTFPTLRKTFKDPFSENFSARNIGIIKYTISIIALIEYNVFTLSYLVVSIIIGLSLVIPMWYHRKKINTKNNKLGT